MMEFTEIIIDEQLSALCHGCDCMAADGDECDCPGAIWFHRVHRGGDQ